MMKSLILKRSVIVAGHKTSVSLEEAFWSGLKGIAKDEHTTLSNLVCDINTHRRQGNLSSALRLFVLDRVRSPISSGHSAGASGLNCGSPQISA
jgi:predicted DNA-binding ribbon-helix-helix protein